MLKKVLALFLLVQTNSIFSQGNEFFEFNPEKFNIKNVKFCENSFNIKFVEKIKGFYEQRLKKEYTLSNPLDWKQFDINKGHPNHFDIEYSTNFQVMDDKNNNIDLNLSGKISLKLIEQLQLNKIADITGVECKINVKNYDVLLKNESTEVNIKDVSLRYLSLSDAYKLVNSDKTPKYTKYYWDGIVYWPLDGGTLYLKNKKETRCNAFAKVDFSQRDKGFYKIIKDNNDIYLYSNLYIHPKDKVEKHHANHEEWIPFESHLDFNLNVEEMNVMMLNHK